MRVQHPEKRQHEIAPAGEPPILTDERGVADVPTKLGNELVKEQGWTRLKDHVKGTTPEPEPVAPAVDNDGGVTASEEG